MACLKSFKCNQHKHKHELVGPFALLTQTWMSTAMKANNPDSDEFRVVTDRNITNVPDSCTEQHADSLNMDIIIARHHLQTIEEEIVIVLIISLQELQMFCFMNFDFASFSRIFRDAQSVHNLEALLSLYFVHYVSMFFYNIIII